MVRFILSPAIQTSVLDLIPHTEETPYTKAAIDSLAHALESQVVIVVSASQKKDAILAADALAETLGRQTNIFDKVTCRISDRTRRDFFETFFKARWSVLSKDHRTMAKAGDSKALADNAIQRLYAPFSGVPSSLIEQDPFFLFEDFTLSMPRLSGQFSLESEHLVFNDSAQSWVLLTATGQSGIFTQNGSSQISDAIDTEIAALKDRFQKTRVLWTGMPRYAAAASEGAQKEVSIIGTGSLLGVVLLLILAFSRVRELIFGLIPILVGILIAASATVTIFGHVHLITLVFGASLVGVCIDYSFHYFAHHLAKDASGAEVLKEVLPGITLGMTTSVIGYIALLIAPFFGLQQMAVFAGIGLLAAYGTVVCWFPFLPLHSPRRRLPLVWSWTARYVSWVNKRHLFAVAVICVPFAIAIPFLQATDDIRLLRGKFPTLEKDEAAISQMIGTFDKSRFLVLYAPTEEMLAQKEESVLARLASLRDQKAIGNFFAAAQLVPSLRVQRQNLAFMKSFVQSNAASRIFEHMGWDRADVMRIRQSIGAARPLQFEAIKNVKAARLFSQLRIGNVANAFVSVVLLKDIHQANHLQQAIRDIPNVSYVDKVQTVTALLKSYRQFSTLLVVAAYGLILLFLIVRYGPKRGLLIILPPLITAIILLGGMSLLQLPTNIFTFVALLIVLAIGIDYTLFFAESSHMAPTAFAIVLSGITTALSFGLLALSQNPALKTFGGTVLAGICLAMLLSPLSRIGTEDEHKFL
ncbi:MAG: MMPL family transporter [Deltaproteobacteria bacterium]|nr:MMPL family transporter [Deltaproteobacteria bacterium]